MQNQNTTTGNYDPRWFIWTIVFLVVTGISLVSYIVISGNNNDDLSAITTPQVQHKLLTEQRNK